MITSFSDIRRDYRLGCMNQPKVWAVGEDVAPLNFFRILAISLFIRFSSSSRTLAPRISAMNCEKSARNPDIEV